MESETTTTTLSKTSPCFLTEKSQRFLPTFISNSWSLSVIVESGKPITIPNKISTFDAITNDKNKVIFIESKSSSPSTLVDQITEVLEYLEKNDCDIRNRAAILKFLLYHPHIIQYLREAVDQIFKYFENYQKTALGLVFDPEIEKDEGELFLNIVTSIEPEEAFSRLDKIDDNWFIPIVAQKALNFNLNIRFI